MSIWIYDNLREQVKPEFQLTQDEGNTAVEELVLKVEENEILIKLKREDTNPNGSFKDRSLAFQTSYYKQKGEKNLVISSTGNAAISAASYCKQAGINLHIFISDQMEESKSKRLEMVMQHGDMNIPNELESKITIHKSKKAKSDAIKFAKENNYPNLRGSVDDIALEGFRTLGYELSKMSDLFDSVFVPCSSGTSTYGMYLGLKELQKENNFKMPEIHIVQTTKVHPIAAIYDKKFEEEKTNAVDAIADRVANRTEQVRSAIENTNGFGWVISSNELQETKELLKHEGFEFSNASTLGIAGIIKASRMNKLTNSPLAIISGL